MSTIIHIYADETAASGIVKKLKEADFDTFVVSAKGADGSARSKDDVVADLKAQRLEQSIAEAYADGLAKGGALVGVHPLFGSASRAAKILDSVPSVATGIEREHATSAVDWSNDATPVSNALGWPVLLDHNTSLSETWGIGPLLTQSGSLFTWFGFKLLSDDNTPISKIFGAPVLLDNPTPLSTKLGIPLLRDV
jgi:hypothetical protein